MKTETLNEKEVLVGYLKAMQIGMDMVKNSQDMNKVFAMLQDFQRKAEKLQSAMHKEEVA